MTVVKYNNCEFSSQNTTEYQSTLSGVGEIMSNICGNMNMDVAPYWLTTSPYYWGYKIVK
jgi:hypothetical protein